MEFKYCDFIKMQAATLLEGSGLADQTTKELELYASRLIDCGHDDLAKKVLNYQAPVEKISPHREVGMGLTINTETRESGFYLCTRTSPPRKSDIIDTSKITDDDFYKG